MIQTEDCRQLGIAKTNTGLLMNFHALAPDKYKRSAVSAMIRRIFRACGTWIKKAKKLLEKNQYPPSFYEPIFKKTLTAIVTKMKKQEETEEEEEEVKKAMVF